MKKEEKRATLKKVINVVGVIACLMILPILVINLVFIIQSYVNPDEVPSLLGITPMVVVTDSMKPTISGGDMIIDRKTAPDDVREGDIISFFDPTRSKRDVVITHRVVGIESVGDQIHYLTKGDANNAQDPVAVPASMLVGVYQKTIPVLGHVVLFMRTTLGVILTVIQPILGVTAYELIKLRRREKEQIKETEQLRSQLESLQAKNADPCATADCAL